MKKGGRQHREKKSNVWEWKSLNFENAIMKWSFWDNCKKKKKRETHNEKEEPQKNWLDFEEHYKGKKKRKCWCEETQWNWHNLKSARRKMTVFLGQL